MSALPLVLEGEGVKALVVGGGAVATRKAFALLEAGASVRVVAPEVSEALLAAARDDHRLLIAREPYVARHLADALIVVAATNDAELNATIAGDAHGRLINVVTAPALGNFVTPAVHRAGEIVVAVSAGGVPGAAIRIRDRIGKVVDERYAAAVAELAGLRRERLDSDDQAGWRAAAASLVGSEFCDEVEAGTFGARVEQWR